MKQLFAIGILLISIQSVFGQTEKNIYGKVIDAFSHPVAKAAIKNSSGDHLALTDENGAFSFIIAPVDSIVFIHCEGFLTYKLKCKEVVCPLVIRLTKVVEDDKLDETEAKSIKLKKEQLELSKATESRRLSTYSDKPTFDAAGRAPIMKDFEESYSGENSNAKSGLLTAGELNDFAKWKLWQDIDSTELGKWKAFWQIQPNQRYTVQLSNHKKMPIANVSVVLMNDKALIWQSTTDNTGKCELWSNAFSEQQFELSKLHIEVKYAGKAFSIKKPKRFEDGINFLSIPADCSNNDKTDIAFLVDATGSMRDEINYLKAEITNIMDKTNDILQSKDNRFGAVVYRDLGEEYVTRFSDLSTDVSTTYKFISSNQAGGGGDTPEAVEAALDVAINQLNWRDESVTKIIFLVLDASPHHNNDVIQKMQLLIRQASEKGIRIVPVACSGIDKSTEYLMRALALSTNGTYVFLTDDSGIGDSHIKPTTDEYKVETLAEIFIRIIKQYSYLPECQNTNKFSTLKSDTLDEQVTIEESDSTAEIKEIREWKYYPNPTHGIVNVETQGIKGIVFLSDINGKALKQYSVVENNVFQIELSDFPDGMYLLRHEYQPDKWLSSKLIKIH